MGKPEFSPAEPAQRLSADRLARTPRWARRLSAALVFALAALPVVLLAVAWTQSVHGTGRALPKHGMVLEEHVDCHVDILEPLPASGDVAALRDAARERIRAALDDRG